MTPVHDLWLLDVLDILLVAVLFYRLLILVKGTRSAQMYVGLLVIVLIGIAAREFDLIAVKWIADSLKTVWLIAFVIIFQPELRHALAQFGRSLSRWIADTARYIVCASEAKPFPWAPWPSAD